MSAPITELVKGLGIEVGKRPDYKMLTVRGRTIGCAQVRKNGELSVWLRQRPTTAALRKVFAVSKSKSWPGGVAQVTETNAAHVRQALEAAIEAVPAKKAAPPAKAKKPVAVKA